MGQDLAEVCAIICLWHQSWKAFRDSTLLTVDVSGGTDMVAGDGEAREKLRRWSMEIAFFVLD